MSWDEFVAYLQRNKNTKLVKMQKNKINQAELLDLLVKPDKVSRTSAVIVGFISDQACPTWPSLIDCRKIITNEG